MIDHQCIPGTTELGLQSLIGTNKDRTKVAMVTRMRERGWLHFSHAMQEIDNLGTLVLKFEMANHGCERASWPTILFLARIPFPAYRVTLEGMLGDGSCACRGTD
jgi:hypothetical protein